MLLLLKEIVLEETDKKYKQTDWQTDTEKKGELKVSVWPLGLFVHQIIYQPFQYLPAITTLSLSTFILTCISHFISEENLKKKRSTLVIIVCLICNRCSEIGLQNSFQLVMYYLKLNWIGLNLLKISFSFGETII